MNNVIANYLSKYSDCVWLEDWWSFLLILDFLIFFGPTIVSPAAHQRGVLVSMWAVPGSWQRGGFTERVGCEQQAVCGKVRNKGIYRNQEPFCFYNVALFKAGV